MSECKELLKQGVYETHIAVQTGNHDEDYKHYFASDEFKKDFKDQKFNYGVKTVVDAVPLELNIGASDAEINEFQRKVRESTTFHVTDSFYEMSAHSIPNKAILDAFVECNKGLGFSLSSSVDGNLATFTLGYSNLDVDQLPIIQGIFVANGTLFASTINVGEEVLNNSQHKFICEFTTEPSLNIVIDTDLTAVSEVAFKKKNTSASSGGPVGTIICSLLPWSKFRVATDDVKSTANGLWNSEYSAWAPCDGREVLRSDYSAIAGVSKVPDARGKFLRGLNILDGEQNANGVLNVNELQKDPEEGRTPGAYQPDAFAIHAHTFDGRDGGPLSGGAGNSDPESRSVNTTHHTGGATETRPKNIAVYYYIRIN